MSDVDVNAVVHALAMELGAARAELAVERARVAALRAELEALKADDATRSTST